MYSPFPLSLGLVDSNSLFAAFGYVWMFTPSTLFAAIVNSASMTQRAYAKVLLTPGLPLQVTEFISSMRKLAPSLCTSVT